MFEFSKPVQNRRVGVDIKNIVHWRVFETVVVHKKISAVVQRYPCEYDDTIHPFGTFDARIACAVVEIVTE